MLRRLITLVTAALALVVLGSAGTAAASPSGFQADEYPGGEGIEVITANAGELGEVGGNRFYTHGTFVECETPWFRSTTQFGPTSTIDTAETAGNECFGSGAWRPMPMSCDFILSPGTAEYKYADGTVSLGPEGCTVWKMEKMLLGCDASIRPGPEFGGSVDFDQGGERFEANPDAVYADVELHGIEVTMEGGSFCQSMGTDKFAHWEFEWELTAEDIAGGVHRYELVAELPFGFYLSGKASETESEQPRFEAESYPRAISGGGLQLTLRGNPITCGESTLSDSIAGATRQLTLDATYGKCTALNGSWSVNVAMNGCSYTLTAQNEGPPYTGKWGIVCPEGKFVEYLAFNAEGKQVCTIKVNPENDLTGVALSNAGSGVDRAVSLDANVEGIDWSMSGSSSVCIYSGTNGTMTGTPTLAGVG